jgi:ABC-type dipeptide/oligopeptide/nickel transport system permease component
VRRGLLNRLLRTVIVLFGLSLVVFLLLNASGDAAAIMAPPTATAEDLDAIRRDLGTDQPLYVQYVRFLEHAIVGDFGTSWKYRQPALQLIANRLPATLELSLLAMAIALVVGGTLGVISAARGGWIDFASQAFAAFVRAMPSFWLGLMFILFFAVRLGWLPTSGRGEFANLVMPATTLALSFVADILLLVRSGLLATMDEDYIRTARAKGLAERTVYLRHALANTAIPVLSVLGITFGRLLGGAVVTETVFSWPGVGSIAIEAVTSRDFPLVEASVFVLALIIVGINLLTDISYGLVDPRIRRS